MLTTSGATEWVDGWRGGEFRAIEWTVRVADIKFSDERSSSRRDEADISEEGVADRAVAKRMNELQ